MANQFLGLSLFIMLLSFFIILTSMSEYETSKSKSVLRSISVAFSGDAIGDSVEPSIVQSPIENIKTGNALEDIEAHFSAEVSGFQIQKNRLGTEMMVTLPVQEFERLLQDVTDYESAPELTDMMRVKQEQPLLLTLLSLMRSSDRDYSYRMDMVLKVPQEAALTWNEKPEQLREQSARISRWAQQIEALGLPQKSLSAGLGRAETSSEEEQLSLWFRRYIPLNVGQISSVLENNEEGSSNER